MSLAVVGDTLNAKRGSFGHPLARYCATWRATVPKGYVEGRPTVMDVSGPAAMAPVVARKMARADTSDWALLSHAARAASLTSVDGDVVDVVKTVVVGSEVPMLFEDSDVAPMKPNVATTIRIEINPNMPRPPMMIV